MTRRVVEALRELAIALEELDLEGLARAPAGSASREEGAASSAAATPASVTSSAVAYHTDLRYYLILLWPGDDSKSGAYRCLWKDLEARLPRKRLAGSGVKLRKVDSLSQAEEIWLRERPGSVLRVHRL
mgnify:CR=1 FL=1